MPERRPLWWRWLLNVLQFDGFIGYPAAQILFYFAEEIRPSPSREESVKRRLFIHAAVSPVVFILGLMLLNRLFAWDWQTVPAVLVIYLVAIAFVDYRRSGDVESLTADNPAKARNLKNRLKSVKLMVVVWALFILGLQFFIP